MKKILAFTKSNLFTLIVLVMLFFCAIQLFQINKNLKSFADYNAEQLDKTESEPDGFYSDWTYRQD